MRVAGQDPVGAIPTSISCQVVQDQSAAYTLREDVTMRHISANYLRKARPSCVDGPVIGTGEVYEHKLRYTVTSRIKGIVIAGSRWL